MMNRPHTIFWFSVLTVWLAFIVHPEFSWSQDANQDQEPVLNHAEDPTIDPMAPGKHTMEFSSKSGEVIFPFHRLRPGALVKVPLPITIATATQVKSALRQLAETAPVAARASKRLAVVLEFETASGGTGRGSELEACQLLARYLVSAELNRIETIAYIPAAKDSKGTTKLSGHAVLVAISANQIAMEQNTALEDAGADEPKIDNLVREVYRGIAGQRLTLPLSMVMALLDKDKDLYRVQTDIGPMFVDGEELLKLEQENKAQETTTLSKAGTAASLSSSDLETFGLVRRQITSRKELEASLDLMPLSLEYSLQFVGKWRAIQVNLPNYIDERSATWVMRSLGSRLSKSDPPNLLVLNLNAKEGNIDACLKLARYLVELDSNQIQSVALVRGTVKGPAAVLALACDHLMMAKDAKLGGTLNAADQAQLTAEMLADLQPEIRKLASDRQTDWSLMMGMLNPDLEVDRYRHKQTGQVRLLTAEELRGLEDRDRWDQLGAIDTQQGLSATTAEPLMIVRSVINDEQELRAYYQMEKEPEILESTALDRSIERFASFLSRPDVAALLLFLAVFMLSTEMSTPGLGLPGFLAVLMFMLFFWSQYLEGNAGWLEIMLFVGGVALILIEIFATPGFGLFGIGGILMVIGSMILASQNFSFSASDLALLPKALIPVLGAALGFFTALFALRNVLPHSPVFKKMILSPRQRALELEGVTVDPEAIVDWSYLQGRRGESLTRLIPSGKARIDGKVYDVLSDGRMVEKGQAIKVVEAVGNRVVVVPED